MFARFIRFIRNRLSACINNERPWIIKNRRLAAAAVIFLLAGAVCAAALSGVFTAKSTRGALLNEKTEPALDSVINPSKPPLSITALDSDSLGVGPASAFMLKFGMSPDESMLASSLRVEPKRDFKLEKVSDKEFSMKFDRPLENDSIYRIIFSDKNTGAEQSWAFQTRKPLNVIRTLPRDKAIQVPVNSGIEIVFNAEKIKDPEKYFEISPKAGGRFEQHGKTLVFVPNDLKESTIYTVTVKKGIGVEGSSVALENDYTFSFQTTVPDESESNASYFAFSSILYNITPQAAPAFQVFTDDKLVDSEVRVDIYGYPDVSRFLDQLKRFDNTPSWAVTPKSESPYNENVLEKAASVNARIVVHRKDNWVNTYLLLPSSLPEGYYLIKANVDGENYYTQLEVNPASVYIMAAKGKILAWLNDSVTGKPMAGAEVMSAESAGSITAVSDKDGLAVLNEEFSFSGDYRTHIYVIKPAGGGLPFVARMEADYYSPFDDYSNSDITDNYWTYIYLDKGIYLPQDTINVWGLIKPRDKAGLDKECAVELVRNEYSMNGDRNVSVLSSVVTRLSPLGTFTASIRLSNFNPGPYEVRVRIGDRVFLTQYMQIMDYVKPAYKVDITPDRNCMYFWETVNFDIKASFFEGTPVKGLKLDYNCGIGGSRLTGANSQDAGYLVSNDSGESKLSIKPAASSEGWRPINLWLNVGNKEAEERQINEYCNVTVFPKDTMIEVTPEINGENGKISIATSKIDLGRLAGKSGAWFSEDEYRGDAVSIPLTAKIYETHYDRRKTGDYYDYINKVRQDLYEYYEVQSLVKECGFTTVNGKYEINFTVEKNKNYRIEVYGSDSAGRRIKEEQYVYSWSFYSPYGNYVYTITGGSDGKVYRQGEKVDIEVVRNEEQPSGAAGGTADKAANGTIASSAAGTAAGANGAGARYLFIMMKNGIADTVTSFNSKYSFVFDKKYIPNMYVKALCFDGANIYNAGIRQFTFDKSENRLNISVKADKKQYRPGDTVKLTLDVRDADGKPCSSEINVSVVDEAYFAVSPQNVDTLSSLYWPSVSSGIVCEYFSYHPFGEMGPAMAELGEGGDVYVRKDFRDSAIFKTVECDRSGKAEVSFRLPDNLTSWRVTYQSATEDLKAGSGKMNIITRLPFFIDTIFNDEFITGDSPSILIRANGTELPAAAKIDYAVTVTDQSGKSYFHKASGDAGSIAVVPLGTLASGNYSVSVKASCGSLKDALSRNFRVSDSLLETSKTEYVSLTQSTRLSNNSSGLTSLLFFGEELSPLHSELTRLAGSWGRRLDQRLAGKIAGELLKKYFNEDIYCEKEFDISKYQTDDGGLALLTYDSSSPSLSAKLCSLAEDCIDREALASYFRKLLDDAKTTPEDAAYAYWGLAALHEPVLTDIYGLLKTGGLTDKIRLILGAALSEIGDYQGARDILDGALKKNGRISDSYACIENGSRDESIDATALCSVIAIKTDAPEKLKLFNYIRSNSTSELLVNIERLIFVKNYIKTADTDCGFSYELDGTKKTVDLKNGGCYRLTVTPEQLGKLKFNGIKGKIIAASTYVAPVSEAISSEKCPASIVRSYSAEGVEGIISDFERSYNIRITITPTFDETAPDGYYEITDVLPAGFRYVAAYPGKKQTWWYPDEVSGQKVVFGYYYNKNKANFSEQSIVYFVRAVCPGSYTADNAAIRYTNGSDTFFTAKTKISIK